MRCWVYCEGLVSPSSESSSSIHPAVESSSQRGANSCASSTKFRPTMRLDKSRSGAKSRPASGVAKTDASKAGDRLPQ